MLRFLKLAALIFFGAVFLIYASPLGFGACIGLMTWDLPSFWLPVLRCQPLAWLFAVFSVPCIAFEVARKNRRALVWTLGIAAMLWVWWLPLARVGLGLRERGLEGSAARLSRDLVVPLGKYRRAKGNYPPDLAVLGVTVETGMVAYRHLTYRRATAESDFAGYEVRMRTGYYSNFDSFFYWPGEKYPAYIYGGSTKTVRAPRHVWAYVNE